ncbi:MAG: PEP-CTERM sorting domain-containing protein [Acidobacteriota bacterium]|nr:PEP-CTERM sorting domain-containing protein [Acidobacteriota bacterium]
MPRKFPFQTVLSAISVLAAHGSISFCFATPFTYSNITVPGSIFTEATGVSSNQIVGDYYANDRIVHGFVFGATGFQTIDYPGASLTEPFGINDAGTIAGYAHTVSTFGFVEGGGNFNAYSVPGSLITQVYGLNSNGDIVGHYLASDGSGHGFELRGGRLTTIDYPGAQDTDAFGINSRGQIVGTYVDTTGRHGFLFDGMHFARVDFPQSTGTQLAGINNQGQIVGSYIANSGMTFGLFLNGGPSGMFSTLSVPGSIFSTALGVNDSGSVVGYYTDVSGADYVTNGFVAAPIASPEPSTMALLGSGVLGLTVYHTRKRLA